MHAAAAAAAKSLQLCPTLCNPIDGSPPGSPVPGILQARTLEWAAISFSHRVHFSVLITDSVLFLLFLLFIQIMIHIQSNMLKTLIDILKDATEGNLSRFVKRHVFSEEVVSVRFLQDSGEGAGALSEAHLVP